MIKKLLIIFLLSFGISFAFIFCLPQSPIVSVVMPTYNREKLLPRAIDSILDQSFHNFEFIIVDDGSTDGSWELLKQYAATDSRIRLIRNTENKGISFSRNRGNDMARGKYIAIMDSDDASPQNRLALSVEYMEHHPETTVLTGWKNGFTTYILARSTDPQDILFTMHFYNSAGHPETMMRRDFMLQHNIRYDEQLIAAIDYDLWRQIIFAGGIIHRIPKFLITYHTGRKNSPIYYEEQRRNGRRTSAAFLEKYGVTEEASKPNCAIARKMLENNASVRLLSDDYLKNKVHELCLDEKVAD